MTPCIFIHGGRCTGAIWGRLIEQLSGPALAVDLPGRNDPSKHAEATFAGWAASVAADMDRAGVARGVLVGHSMAGGTMAAMARLYPERVAGVIWFAAVVPPDGGLFVEGLSELQQAHLRAQHAAGVVTLDREGEREAAATPERAFVYAAESSDALAPFFEPVSLAGLAKTRLGQVRLLQDRAIERERQDLFLARLRALGPCEVRDVDANHMAMVNAPEASAAAIESLLSAFGLAD